MNTKPREEESVRDTPVYKQPPEMIPMPQKKLPFWRRLVHSVSRKPIFWYLLMMAVLAMVLLVNRFQRENGGHDIDLTFTVSLFLLDYFRMPAGLQILASIRVGGAGLLNSLKCGLVLILVWACVSYQFFDHEIDKHNVCTNSYQCIGLGIDSGLKGDIGLMHGDKFG